MPYAVLSDEGLVEVVEPTLKEAVGAADDLGASDVVIDAAATGRRENPPPKARGALKQLRLPGQKTLAISGSAIDMDLSEAWRRLQAVMPPFVQRGKTGIEREFYPAKTRANLVRSFLGQNAKLQKKKGDAANVDVFGLSLTPYWMYAESEGLTGRVPNVCAGSSAACRHSCLVFAGQNYAADWSIYSKFQKTRVLFQEPEAFGRILYEACLKHQRNASRKDFLPAIRLNVLSDIPWELVFPSLFEALPELQFYDYTKVVGRQPPWNYDLTFSNSGGNLKQVERQLASGGRVAVVAHVPQWRAGAPVQRRVAESKDSFDARKEEATHRLWSSKLPSSCTINGVRYPVIDGDINDVRFLDPEPAIIALRWKDPGGQAAARAPEALKISRRTKFVVEIEDFCGLWIGAVTPSEQPDTEIQTVFSLEPLEAQSVAPAANPRVRYWGSGRAGYGSGSRARGLSRKLSV